MEERSIAVRHRRRHIKQRRRTEANSTILSASRSPGNSAPLLLPARPRGIHRHSHATCAETAALPAQLYGATHIYSITVGATPPALSSSAGSLFWQSRWMVEKTKTGFAALFHSFHGLWTISNACV
jgi:hypothetical protein